MLLLLKAFELVKQGCAYKDNYGNSTLAKHVLSNTWVGTRWESMPSFRNTKHLEAVVVLLLTPNWGTNKLSWKKELLGCEYYLAVHTNRLWTASD